jgi:cell wall-associated NlpC family hydrolase
VDHVGIYIGNGQFLHAPRTGRDVTVSSLTTGYWAQKYLEARRLATGS